MAARALMFQGTGSDVGKSLIVAGLARALTLRGLKVRPFKPQNMSNNAAVTADGGEVGRAQAVQGRVHGSAKAAAYQKMKPELMPFVLDSFTRVKSDADIVLVEGAGSAAEV